MALRTTHGFWNAEYAKFMLQRAILSVWRVLRKYKCEWPVLKWVAGLSEFFGVFKNARVAGLSESLLYNEAVPAPEYLQQMYDNFTEQLLASPERNFLTETQGFVGEWWLPESFNMEWIAA